MPTFTALILTAPPAGLAAETGGAYLKVDGREALLRSVELFLNRDEIKQVFVVFSPEESEEGRKKFGTHLGLFGVKVITAGPRWIDQVASAGEKLTPQTTHVLIHDAARPAVPYTDIDSLLQAAEKSPAAALATPVRSTLIETDEGHTPMAFHTPSAYHHLLTPIAYSLETYKEIASTKKEPHASKYTLLRGSPYNVRIGGAGEVSLLKAMLNLMPKPKSKGMNNPFEEAQW